jgi:TonB-dependent Receptor Plug Domain
VNLIPADYQVSVSAPGFKTATSKVTLTVGAKQELSLSLTVGEITQTVEITGAAPIIETTNATLAGNIQSAQIVELPLNGRDWASLATLEPGVVAVRPHEQVTQPGGNLRGLGNQMTIDGNRPTQNVYRLNGVIVNDYSNAGPGNVLGASVGVDAIQEFSVLTANYSAEYGFTSGGVINAINKSGTNQFHGSAFEFVRNKAFDSSDYLSGANKPPFVRNQFGASGGWKVLKDKAFLFGAYEGLRQRKGIPVTAKVITADARLGIVHDPKTGALLPALSGPCPFPNMQNLAPGQAAVCVDNTIAAYIAALDPLPQPGASVKGDFASNVYSGVQGVTDNYFTLRTDLKISDKDSVNAEYYRDHSTWSKPNAFDNITTGYILPNQTGSIEENHVFSPAMVNSVRVGYTQSIVTNPGLTHSLAAQVDPAFGILPTTFGPGEAGQGGGGAGVTGMTSFGGFAPQGGFSDWVQNFQVFDDVSRTFGNHSLKFGVEFIRNHTDLINANGNGSAGFGAISNFLQNEPFTVREPTVPPFTAGNTKHYNRESIFGVYVQDDWKMRPNLTVNVGLRYEMSTIPNEINGKFILLPTLWSDPGNCSEDINGLPVAATCSGLANKVFDSNPTLKNFEPRVGFSWDPFKTGKTTIRAGFGMFDVLPLPFMFGLNALQASPSGAEVDLTNGNSCPTGVTVASLACPVTQGSFISGLGPLATGVSPANSGRWQYTDRNPKRNYVMQWNANVQRQLTANSSITVAYAGSVGIHNPFQTDTLNTCFPTKTSAGWLFPDPEFNTDSFSSCPGIKSPAPTGIVPNTLVNPFVPGLILSTAFFSQSSYKSLQVNYTKKMSHGLQYEASFTWQKSVDNSSGSFAGDNYSSNPTAATPWWDGAITKGLSDFNISRNLTVNWLYDIPTPKSFGGPAGWIARGWGVGGLLSLSDGVPMWPMGGLSTDPLGQNNSEPMDVLSLAPGCTTKNVVQSGNLQYLRPECFTYPLAPNMAFATANCNQNPNLGPKGAAGTLASFGLDPLTCTNLLGNLPRNSIIGPGLFNIDMSVIKDSHISKFGENFNIQFRAEFFNILNRTNYSAPTDNIVTMDPLAVDSFGVIDQQTQVPMREIQFALKIVF